MNKQRRNWHEDKLRQCHERAQTGTDLILHGAVHDLVSEGIMDELTATVFVAESMIRELQDHGLEIFHNESGNARVRREQ